jgi:hypothetical protein
VTTPATPAFFENQAIPVTSSFSLDSAAEDCSTGIALAGTEESSPSRVFIADLTQAKLTAGSPGTWTAPSQNQTLAESVLVNGPSGLAVAQGTHTGVVAPEFGGNTITAIALPTTSGSGTPAITDWVSCNIPSFSVGKDPHTVTAYQSPSGAQDAIALLANDGATELAVVDLTKMLALPRDTAGHFCAALTLSTPAVVNFIPVP